MSSLQKSQHKVTSSSSMEKTRRVTLSAACFALVCFLAIDILIFASASCKQRPNVEEESANDKKLVPQYIAQADELYAQREDIARLRQGVALLRQAHTADTANYEAA